MLAMTQEPARTCCGRKPGAFGVSSVAGFLGQQDWVCTVLGARGGLGQAGGEIRAVLVRFPWLPCGGDRGRARTVKGS